MENKFALFIAMLFVSVSIVSVARAEAPSDKQLIRVSGSVNVLTRDRARPSWSVTAIDSFQAINGQIVTRDSVQTDRKGNFELNNLDVEREIVIAVISDDGRCPHQGWHSRLCRDRYFPTVNVLAMYGSSAQAPRVDIESAKVFALPTQEVRGWESIAGLEGIEDSGFVVGTVIDAKTSQPISGAVIQLAKPGNDPLKVVYPEGSGKLAFTGMQGRFVSSDSWLRNPTLARVMSGEIAITATAPGYQCAGRTAMIEKRTAFFVPILCTRN